MPTLPASPPSFLEKKRKILEQLSVPDADYNDASPKGSVDEGIRDLIDEINAVDGFVTTSSCAGRVSVFLEGRKTADEDGQNAQVAGVGGKGAGGTWLYVSHEPVLSDNDVTKNWVIILGLEAEDSFQREVSQRKERRLIHFKFEAMILHIFTASPDHAQLILRCGLQAGFRESGALNIIPSSPQDVATPIVAIRSMGLAFESLIGHQVDGVRQRLVPPQYLQTLLRIANERFAENTKRIGRFQAAFRDAVKTPLPRRNPEGEEWEDAATRRERKRVEGLRRKAELQARGETEVRSKDDLELGISFNGGQEP